MAEKLKIAICFFGITRSLSYTIDSIRKNVITPAKTLADVNTFGHFFDISTINNPRTEEYGSLPQNEHSLIDFDELILEDPNCTKIISFEAVAAFGDCWSDEFVSLSNLVAQLHSLHQVTQLALAVKPDLVVFARPDLEYHDSILPVLHRAAKEQPPCLFLPYWQQWNGYNDRFAIVRGRQCIEAYGYRGLKSLEFCKLEQRALHSELLLKHALAGKRVQLIPQRAGRVRFNGKRHRENYSHPNEERLGRFLVHVSKVLPFLQGRELSASKFVCNLIYGDREIT